MGNVHPNQVAFRRQLMDVQVPVSVVVARKSMEIHQLLQIVPGTMLQFSQLCDEPLSVEVIGHPIAKGIAVKIGDKFGLKITEMSVRE